MDKEWDFLIVLDACRYDFFKRIYDSFFEGKLEKIWSLGSETQEWLINTFKGRYDDIVYISGNPYVGSISSCKDFNWSAKNHFYQVLDVWDERWNDRLNTVHPRDINECLRYGLSKYPTKRFIIHYIQPHAPYLNFTSKYSRNGPCQNGKLVERLLFFFRRGMVHLSRKFGPFIYKRGWLWYIRKINGLTPQGEMEEVVRREGDKKLRQTYLENLRVVLRCLAKIIKEKDLENVVITADHGEMLGEFGAYGHVAGLKSPLLREVPFFRVKKSKYRETNLDKIKKRLHKVKSKVRNKP